MSELGDRLQALRQEKGVSVADLAQAGGIDESTMGAILAGEIDRPPDRRLRGFAEALKVSFESLLDLVPEARRAEAGFDRAACAAELIAAAPPEWIQLLPLGEVRFRDARDPCFVREAAAVIAASLAEADALPIDYDHQIDFASKGGNAAPAAGWLRELQVRDDGIWGRVEWTARGGAAVAAKEYRFISPVFEFNKNTRAVVKIMRAGLTNDPALTLKAVASRAGQSREGQTQEGHMDELLKKLREALGLAEAADEKAVCAAVAKAVSAAKPDGLATMLAKACGLPADTTAETLCAQVAALKAKETAALSGVAKALGLAEDADAKTVETAAAKAVTGAARAADRDELAARVEKLEGENLAKAAGAAVEAAIQAGKLTPGQRDWGLAYAKKDPEGFDAFAAAQPVILEKGAKLPGGKIPRGDGGLTADEKALCAKLGLAEEAFKKTRDAEAEKEAAR